ncbi:unnamed protein product, partial [Didymodactylos carnosus]
MGQQVAKLATVDFSIQFVGWIISTLFHTEKFYDLTGSLTFIALTYLSLNNSRRYLRQNVQSTCVFVWALRLGAYLFYRILQTGKDARFDEIRDSPVKLFGVWMMQGVWVLITLLPTIYVNRQRIDRKITTTDYLGWSIWLFGFLFEIIADGQKYAFKNNPANRDKFIDSGLWSISRHPNYFGEICAWSGLYISSSHMLQGFEHLCALSPIFVTLMISFLSGIPPQERSAMKRFGGNPAYRFYRSTTPIL